MKLDFYSKKSGAFTMEVQEDDNFFLIARGSRTKEEIQEAVVELYKMNGCVGENNPRKVSDVSREESVELLKHTIDTQGQNAALYNIYSYAYAMEAVDLVMCGMTFDFRNLLDEDSLQAETPEDDMEMG